MIALNYRGEYSRSVMIDPLSIVSLSVEEDMRWNDGLDDMSPAGSFTLTIGTTGGDISFPRLPQEVAYDFATQLAEQSAA